MKSGGNVGIGTSIPVAILHVRSSFGQLVAKLDNDAGQKTILRFAEDGVTRWDIYNNNGTPDNNLDVSNAMGTLVFSIQQDGNVGIGVSAPSAKLDFGQLMLYKGLGVVANASDIFFDKAGLIASENNLWFNVDADNNNSGSFHFSKGTETSTGTKLMSILNSGYVGISTDQPEGTLHISDIGTTGPTLFLEDGSSTEGDITWDVNEVLNIGRWNKTTDTFTEDMRITSSGNVGIGDNNPGYRLELPNTASVLGKGRANSWVTYSSIRWKENVNTLEDALDKISKIRGVEFNWKKEHGGTHDVGFIAEELGTVLPEAIDWEEDNSGYAKGASYSKVVPLLVEAVKDLSLLTQEQQQIIEQLKAEQISTDMKLETLNSQIEALNIHFDQGGN